MCRRLRAVFLLTPAACVALHAATTASPSEGAGDMVVSLDGEWLLATDPDNVGREARWWKEPAPRESAVEVYYFELTTKSDTMRPQRYHAMSTNEGLTPEVKETITAFLEGRPEILFAILYGSAAEGLAFRDLRDLK